MPLRDTQHGCKDVSMGFPRGGVGRGGGSAWAQEGGGYTNRNPARGGQSGP